MKKENIQYEIAKMNEKTEKNVKDNPQLKWKYVKMVISFI